MIGHAAEGDITVLLPPLRMQCDKGQQINGSLEGVHPVAGSAAVETVPGIAASCIPLEACTKRVQPAFVGMTGSAVFIVSDEHGVVMLSAAIRRWLRTLIDQFCVDERVQHLPADAPVLEQIGVHPAHIRASGRKRKRFFLPAFIPVNRFKCFALFTIQQPRDRLRVRHPIKLLQERDRPAALLCGVIVPFVSPDGNAMVADKPLFRAGGQHFFALPEQELFQINLAGAALLVVREVDIWNLSHPFLDFPIGICYTDFPEGMQMQVVVLHGTLTEAEQDVYVRQATEVYPMSIIEKLYLDVQGDHVAVSYDLHRFRNMRKMGGYCIGEPSGWNAAKQAELRDTVPNSIDF